jgi:GNAT superfamily N-acetyltransferase
LTLTLHDVVRRPALATYTLAWPEGATLAPLQSSDVSELKDFFCALSSRTRGYFLVSTPEQDAQERCEAIGRYDKLRLAVRVGGEIVALSEFSLDLTTDDLARYAGYGEPLRAGHDCRWGVCLRDDVQGRGLATALATASFSIANAFGRTRVLLWGGVFETNDRARRFYLRTGFREVGRFVSAEGRACVDMMRG